jgi:hypothetical protein
MVTIQHLEVILDVEGSEEEAAFARMFDKYVRRWHRAMEEERARAGLVEGERRIHPVEGPYA